MDAAMKLTPPNYKVNYSNRKLGVIKTASEIEQLRKARSNKKDYTLEVAKVITIILFCIALLLIMFYFIAY